MTLLYRADRASLRDRPARANHHNEASAFFGSQSRATARRHHQGARMKTAEVPLDDNLDQRRDVRSGITVTEPQNSFSLRSDAGVHSISAMRDVSISGVGIEIRRDGALRPGTKIMLEYTEQDFALVIDGTVMWCNPTGNDRLMMGVKFEPRNQRDNCLFFLALRKYHDEFDGAYIDA
jgi:hypothetical protein